MDSKTTQEKPNLELENRYRDVALEDEKAGRPKWLERNPFMSMSPSHPAKATKKILIVEDQEDNSELIETLLEVNGYKAAPVKNATQAIEYCKKKRPEMVLMDLGLPDINGLELTHQLKKKYGMEDVPFIAVTAHTSARMQDLAGEAGCVAFIAKPWYPTELIKTIESFLSPA